MNLLILAGSTIEKLDDMHIIEHLGERFLGAIIGEEFSKEEKIEKIFFICGKDARYPWQRSSLAEKFSFDEWSDKIVTFHVETYEEINETLDNLLETYSFDMVVNLLSIFHYEKSVCHLLKDKNDAKCLIEKIAKDFNLSVSVQEKENQIESHINKQKIESGYERLFIEQYPTRKILKKIQDTAINSIIVSSKFEFNEQKSELISSSKESLQKNGTDIVLGMDLLINRKQYKEHVFLVKKDDTKEFYSFEDLANELYTLLENK